jgi:hypothetical protein
VSTQEPDEAELRAALEDQMRRITVQDVVIQTVVTLINLGGRRLGLAGPPEQAGVKDLEQAHLAIEAARALAPLLAEEQFGPVKDALSQLQMAYVQEAQKAQQGSDAPADEGAEASGQGAEGEGTGPAQAPPAAPAEDAAAEAERAKARSKIWTPPGA